MITTPMFKVLEARSKFEASAMPLYLNMLDTELRTLNILWVGTVSIDLTQIISLWEHWEAVYGLGRLDRQKVLKTVVESLLTEKGLLLKELTLSGHTLVIEADYVCSER